MRKKLKMRGGCKPAKFAEGGSVRRPSLISNNPVGSNRARGRVPVGATAGPADETMSYDLRPAAMAGAGMGGVGGDLPMPPEFVAPPARSRRAPARRREMSADDLNEREMTRILNERSLAAAQAGRNMYAKGGLINAKKGNPFAKAAPGDAKAPPFGGMAKPKKAKKGAS